MATVLVTGGTGFLGSQISDALVAAGWSVRILDLRPPEGALDRREFIQADIRDQDAVRRAAEGCDVVVDNAALVPVSRSSADEFMSVNVDGCRSTLAAAREVGAYVVHVSSSSIYGKPRQLPVTERSPLAPFEPYGRSKAEAEQLVHREREAGLVVSSLRSRALLGRGRLGLFEIIFSRIRAGKRVPMFGRGSNIIQMCDARDFAAAVIAAIEHRANDDYNVGAAAYGTVREDLQGLIRRVGSTSTLVPVPVLGIRAVLFPLHVLGWSPFTPWHWVASGTPFSASIEKAERDLGWRPRHSNIDALETAYGYFVAGVAGSSPHSSRLPGVLARILRGD